MTYHSRSIVLGLAALAVAMVVPSLVPDRPRRQDPTLEAPVPMLESTPTADAGVLLWGVMGAALPKPGPNQIKDPDKCEAPGQWRSSACWMPVADVYPPCDPKDGKRRTMWPDGGKCWVPMAEAKPVPTTGGSHTPGVADP